VHRFNLKRYNFSLSHLELIKSFILAIALLQLSCRNKVEKIKPSVASISESVYASGIMKSSDQYQVFSTVSGIIDHVFVVEGQPVKKGTVIFAVSNEIQQLNKQNTELTERFSDIGNNQDQLSDARQVANLAKNKMTNDSLLLSRQNSLWAQDIGTKVDLEQKGLNYQGSKTAYYSATIKYHDLRRQLSLQSAQSKMNLQISRSQAGDYTIVSKIDGTVYNLLKSKGELVTQQTPLAVIGGSDHFLLELQVDEYDILKVKKGLQVLVTMDSYKGEVFEARISKVFPFMNEQSKTFLVEAEFLTQPGTLYPNLTLEANIVLRTKDKALLIPRSYMLNDSTVIRSGGEKVVVKTGLKDYQMVEIISGIGPQDELMKPQQ
jgi:HlyD family secretion protein